VKVAAWENDWGKGEGKGTKEKSCKWIGGRRLFVAMVLKPISDRV